MLAPFSMRLLAFTLALFSAISFAQSSPSVAHHPPPSPKKNGESPIVFWNMPQSSVDFLLKYVPQTNPIRLAQLRQTFHDLQCRAPNLRELAFPGGKNLLCTLPAGRSSSLASPEQPQKPNIIVFLADYKHEGRGQSAVDNWTGALMVPFIYHALTVAPRIHTFLFAEVEGAAGARALLDSFSVEERRRILGVVALDCLGLGPLRYFVNSFDSLTGSDFNWLSFQLEQAALDEHVPAAVSALPGGWFKVDPTGDFRYNNIQSIVLFTVDFKSRKIPGSSQDTYASLKPDMYYENLDRLAVYAVELDKSWPSEAKPQNDAIHPTVRSRH